MAEENPKFAISPDAKLITFGRRIIAVEISSYEGKPQARLTEVQAIVDPEDMTKVKGWRSVFQGIRLSGSPDAMRDFLTAARAALPPGR